MRSKRWVATEVFSALDPTSVGAYLRRYWHPVIAVSELEGSGPRAVPFFGEDLVLYRDGAGDVGLLMKDTLRTLAR